MASCGHDAPFGSAFCPVCGIAISVLRCRCGAASRSGDVYCHHCGQVVAQENGFHTSSASTRIKLSQLVKLVPATKVTHPTNSAKASQNDILDLIKGLQREPRKKKTGSGDASS